MKRIAEGKTKIIFEMDGQPGFVKVYSKDDITGGNGKRHDVVPGKGELATRTTCNVFRLLKERGVPVSFCTQTGPTEFVAEKCTMLPYEVVVRREAHGSYLKRYPKLKKGEKLPQLVVELFLKTTGRKWKHWDLPCDDPLMFLTCDGIDLYLPDVPLDKQEPFLSLAYGDVFTQKNEHQCLRDMGLIACEVFITLEDEWAKHERRLVDFKVEFGLNAKGELKLSDVIDNDSWRIVFEEKYEDKQGFRDGDEIAKVMVNYRRVAELTDRFAPQLAST